MRSAEKTTTRWATILIPIAIGLLLVACGSDEEEATPQAEACEKEATVETVEIEVRDDEYYAVVGGHHFDACSKTGSITQRVEGDTIYMTVCTTRPEGMVCAQSLMPFKEEIVLQTEGLSPGEYTVYVNEVTTTLTIP
jgi:hypothetical protein